MGEELYELRRVVAPLPEKLNQIEQRDPSSLSFTQAARLVGMGASVDDLTQSCGLSKAEAELISRLHQAPAASVFLGILFACCAVKRLSCRLALPGRANRLPQCRWRCREVAGICRANARQRR